jgi:hypothetical protein
MPATIQFNALSLLVCWLSQIRSYFTTDGESASMSWYLAPLRDLSEGCCLKVAVFFLWDVLSDERTGL